MIKKATSIDQIKITHVNSIGANMCKRAFYFEIDGTEYACVVTMPQKPEIVDELIIESYNEIVERVGRLTTAEEYLAKYWHDTEYAKLDKTDIKACEESRSRFRKWVDENMGNAQPKEVGE